MDRSQPNRLLLFGFVGVTVVSFLTAYFVKPHAPNAEIVSPPLAALGGTSSPGQLAERVAKSYNLAFVLVSSEFSQQNAVALESIRNWANQSFRKDPNFLRPASLESLPETNHSIIDSFSYSILASIRYFFEERAAEFLRWRIAAYQTSQSYNSFVTDYYDLFGNDTDSVTLLSRYQSQRARDAVDPLLCAVFWLLCTVTSVWYFANSKSRDNASSSSHSIGRMQRACAWLWIALSLFYVVSGWVHNQVSILTSAIVCGAIGFYIRFPIKVAYTEGSGLRFELLRLSKPIISLIAWISISFVFIRIITWIKTGTLLHPDPISLIVAGCLGDFVHDPSGIKRTLDQIIGVTWAALTIYVLMPYFSSDENVDVDYEEDLSSLQRSYF